MSDFDWNAHPVVSQDPSTPAPGAVTQSGGFNWDDHPVVGSSQVAPSAPAAQPPQSPDEMIAAKAQQLNDAGDTSNDALFDTLTAGHLPQIKAKVKQLLSGEGVANDADYLKRRDEEIADIRARAEKYPAASLEGKVAGFLAPMLLTGGGSAAAEGVAAAADAVPALAGAAGDVAPALAKQTLGKAILKGSATGGALGAAQNPGDKAGVVDPLQLDQRAKNAGIGVLAGGVLAGAANKIPDVADAVKGYAETKAFKASGAMLKDFRKGYANDSIEDTGRFILDNGLAKVGDSFDSISDKASTLKNDLGEQLGTGYDAAAKILPKLGDDATSKVQAAGFNPVRDKAEILDSVKSDLGPAFKRKQALAAVSDYLDDLAEQHGNKVLNPKVTNQIKTALDKTAINWERNPLAREPDSEAALKSMREYLNGKVKGQVQAIGEAIGDPEAAQRLSALNSRYGMASNVERMASDRANREGANRAFGLTDTIAAGEGAETGARLAGPVGALIGGVVGGAGNKVARTFGPAAIASSADSAAKVLAKFPSLSTLQQSNPEVYKELVGAFGANPTKANAVSLVSNMKAESAPMKGPDKWANDGHEKLMDHATDENDQKMLEQSKGALLADPKAKALLMQASDLKPGSKAMESVLSKIKAKAKIASDE